MDIRLCLLVVSCILTLNHAWSQVEHNFVVGPQNTTCDSLPEIFQNKAIALDQIRAAKFRFTQQFEIVRPSGFQGANYYSCDGKNGFLLVKNDNQNIIFKDVPTKIWEEFIQSNNMEGYFLKKIKQQYPTLDFDQ